MSVVVKHLTKYFGQVKAVDNITFKIDPGEVVGFLGPNGAGKTTSIRIITGFLKPTSGTVEVNGLNVQKNPYQVHRLIGYLPEENPLYPDMDIIDYLDFIAKIQDVPKRNIPDRIRAVLDTFQLQEMKHIDIGALSKGYRQRVGLAQSMIHDPQILMLDEPTNGLDPNQILEFRRFVKELKGDKTIILSTHALSEVQALCDRVIIIGRGKIIEDTSIHDLQRKFEGRLGFLVELESPNGSSIEEVQEYLENLSAIEAVAALSGNEDGDKILKFYIESRNDADIRKEIFQLCVDRNLVLLDLHRQHLRMEDIFHQLTTK
ncbi:MAG TPA: ATP-binding cassette domain-containing protein [Bacteroidota bacterium]|nr:ATP-binding cassette domain-containing protein [Bacteroidota bacterium]